MELLTWCLGIAWKLLIVGCGWMALRYIVRNGKGAFAELLETIGVMLKTAGIAIRKGCLNYLKREADKDEGRVEARVE